ncbi:MAG: uncharacterized protein K0S45_1484 [Nitrospira sp.]|jgi:hypothetical protein|nr:uncharacterized protein [Nitrospira sp.]
MRRAVVNIDSLVLKGFRYEDRHAIAQGLQEQLTRLLSEPGKAEGISEIGTIPRLPVGSITAEAGDKPQQIGTATAHEIVKGLDL